MNIDTFKERFTKDRFAANRFNVVISGAPEDLNILCRSVSIPAISIFTDEYMGPRPTFKIPYTSGFEDATLSFYMVDFSIKKFFEDWIKEIVTIPEDVDNGIAYSVAYSSEYRRDIEIQHLSVTNQVLRTTVLRGAFPLNDGTIIQNVEEATIPALEIPIAFRSLVHS